MCLPMCMYMRGFPDGSVGKESACSAGDLGLIPESGRSREGNGNPHQYSCLGNPMDREAWWATVHGVARVRHDLATKPASHVYGHMYMNMHTARTQTKGSIYKKAMMPRLYPDLYSEKVTL